MTNRDIKIAIVHEWLVEKGGAEKVVEALCEIYPKADIFTLFYKKENFLDSVISKHKIYTSFLQKVPRIFKIYRMLLPFYPIAIKGFNLKKYDVIISSHHAVSHGIKTNKKKQLHISYTHTPMRYVWSGYNEYIKDPIFSNIIIRVAGKIMLNLLRKWDVSVSKRPHFYIANSKEVKRRIKKYYKRESTVIYPPVDVEKLIPSGKIIKEDYYIAVSRLVPYKKTDLIVKTFKILKNRKIKIVGTGPEFNRLLKMAGNAKNIEFLGWVDDTKKINIIQKARALIFAAHEDFGIVPVEAQAAGTPVIAYAKGGVLETVIDGKTGILFERQAVNSLINAIKRFESANFKTHILIENAKKFSKERFKREFTNFVAKKIKETGRI